MTGLGQHMKEGYRVYKGGRAVVHVIIIVWVVAAIADWLGLTGSYNYGQVLGGESALLPPLTDGVDGIHWLGTDSVGRDVLAGMIHGASVSLILSAVVIIIAVFIGLVIGMLMGYYGDKGLRLNVVQYLWLAFMICLAAYYKMDVITHGLSLWSGAMTVAVAVLLIGGWHIQAMLPLKRYALPIDAIWQRVFEVKESLPNLFMLLAIAAVVTRPSLWTLALSLIVLYWVTFARFARVEMQRIKGEDYIMAATAQGLDTWTILVRHALPNMLSSILVVIAFSLSGVILVEASLSFLGIGLPIEEVTWGKILSEARKSSSAWWLALFPGLAIFGLIYAFNTVADVVRDRH